jgi:hypothetical protein
MSKRKTIPLIEPEYMDEIVCSMSVFTREDLKHKLLEFMAPDRRRKGSTVRKHIKYGKLYPSTLGGYILIAKSAGIVRQINSGVFQRTELGDAIARIDDTNERKRKWYTVLRKDPAFNKYFRYIETPRTAGEINDEFNPASGKYFRRWGFWLGIQAANPQDQTYVLKDSDYYPGMEMFFEYLADAYSSISKSEYTGVPRYDVTIPEVRFEVCQRMNISPLTFDSLLMGLLRDQRYSSSIQIFELFLGRAHKEPPKWVLEQPFRFKGRQYLYISIEPRKERA